MRSFRSHQAACCAELSERSEAVRGSPRPARECTHQQLSEPCHSSGSGSLCGTSVRIWGISTYRSFPFIYESFSGRNVGIANSQITAAPFSPDTLPAQQSSAILHSPKDRICIHPHSFSYNQSYITDLPCRLPTFLTGMNRRRPCRS